MFKALTVQAKASLTIKLTLSYIISLPRNARLVKPGYRFVSLDQYVEAYKDEGLLFLTFLLDIFKNKTVANIFHYSIRAKTLNIYVQAIFSQSENKTTSDIGKVDI